MLVIKVESFALQRYNHEDMPDPRTSHEVVDRGLHFIPKWHVTAQY